MEKPPKKISGRFVAMFVDISRRFSEHSSTNPVRFFPGNSPTLFVTCQTSAILEEVRSLAVPPQIEHSPTIRDLCHGLIFQPPPSKHRPSVSG